MRRYALIVAPQAAGKTTLVDATGGRWGRWSLIDSDVPRYTHNLDVTRLAHWLSDYDAPDYTALLAANLPEQTDGLMVAAVLPDYATHAAMVEQRTRQGEAQTSSTAARCLCGDPPYRERHAYRLGMLKRSLADEREQFTAAVQKQRVPVFDTWESALEYIDKRVAGMKDILNLGAGNRLVAGAVHHDRVKHRDEISVVHDLNRIPWPWDDNSFDLVEAWAVFEHLDHDLVASLNECWRILRPGGVLKLKLPLWNQEVSWTDPTHRWFYTLKSLDYFDPETKLGRDYTFYTPHKWKIERVEPVKNSASFRGHLRVRK